MSSVPAGQRSWKCPECGGEILLSVAKLDPLACDACLNKMKGGNNPGGISATVSGPLGIWASLPEALKLGIVIAALAVGLLIGYVAGKSATVQTPAPHRGAEHSNEAASPKATSSHDEPAAGDDATKRPEPPGPGYKWVRGRKRKDGTYGEDHWAKDPHYDEKKPSGK